MNLDPVERCEKTEIFADGGDHGGGPSQTSRGEAAVRRRAPKEALAVPKIDRQMTHRHEIDGPGKLSADLHVGGIVVRPESQWDT